MATREIDPYSAVDAILAAAVAYLLLHSVEEVC